MKKSLPLISIVTPSYNQGQYLEETIRSVILQDYPNIEFILVDGGSTDNSLEIIEKYKSHFDWWVSEKDNGQSDAINKGFQRATGEFIAWLNSDDLYTENAVTKAVNALLENPDAAFVYSDMLSIDPESRVFNTMEYGDWGLRELMQFNVIGQPAIFMRRGALEAVGGLDEEYDLLMDHQLWIKMAAEYPIAYVKDFWAAARFHPTAKNRTRGGGYGEEAFIIVDWMKTHPLMKEITSEDLRKIVGGAYRIQARYLLDTDDFWKSFSSYVKGALTHYPSVRNELNRMVFALASTIFPIDFIRKGFINKRTSKVEEMNLDRFLAFIHHNDKETQKE